MRAVVLAGGKGTRLRPYTQVLPKPLMPVGDRPILDIVMRQLRNTGFTRVTISTGYLAELIEAFFRDGSPYGVTIDYCREDEPLGTVGALSLIEDLDEPFLVMNGDVLTDIDYAALLREHTASDAAITIATKQRDVQVSLGVLEFEDEADPTRLTGYVEKPKLHYEASIGVYCMSPRVLDHIEPGVRLDFPDLVLRLIEAGEVVRGHRWDGYWLDIGRHEDFERANEEFEQVRARLLPDESSAPSMLGEALRL
jgi:NDP-sugar pyrophosphorylase family protein